MLRSALLALLLSLPAEAAQPEGALSLGARFDGSSFSGLALARAGLRFGPMTPSLRTLAVAAPGTFGWAVGTELRWTSPTELIQAQLAVGAGIGQIVQRDPLLTQRTPLGLYTNASAGLSFRQSAQVRWGLELAVNHWAGMGDLGPGGATYHMPLDRPYWLASVAFTPAFSP